MEHKGVKQENGMCGVLAPIDISISRTQRYQSIPNFPETIIEMVALGHVCSGSPEPRRLEQ